MEDIYVVGVGMTPFGRMLDKDIKTLTKEAVSAALADAQIGMSALEAAYFANASQGHMEKQHMIRGQIALRSMGIGQIPVVNVENACASGSSALNLAVNFLKAGGGDIALAIGAEKMFSRDRELMFGVFDGAWDVSGTEEIGARLMKLGEGIDPPPARLLTSHIVFSWTSMRPSHAIIWRHSEQRSARLPPSPPRTTSIPSKTHCRNIARPTPSRRC